MSLVTRTGAVLAMALFVSGPARANDEVSALLKKTLEAYGGEKALSRAAVIRQTGKLSSSIRPGEEAALVRLFARPSRLRLEITYPGEATEVRVVDGARGWRGAAGLPGPALAALRLQAARLALPWLLLEKKARLEGGGQFEHEGRILRELRVALDDGLTLTVLIDPDTGRILHTGGKVAGKAPHWGQALEYLTSYSAFEKVDGVLFPFHEISSAMGQRTGETRLLKIERLPQAPKQAFEPG